MKEKQGTDRSVPWMPDPGSWYADQDIVPLAAHPCLEDRINALKGEVRLAGRELETDGQPTFLEPDVRGGHH